MVSSDGSDAPPARFRIVRPVGQGASSTVYRAFDTFLQCDVALKVLHPHLLDSADAVERFRHEALVGQQLRHPGIAFVYDLVTLPPDAGEAEGPLALVQELVEGTSFLEHARTLTEEGREQLAAQTLAEIGSALEHAHQHGVLHRDVKPSNILVGRDGALKLSDFGIARSLAGHQSGAESVIGTIQYLAPELTRGEGASAASDFYSLGMVVRELLLLDDEAPEESGARPRIASSTLAEIPPRFQPVLGALLSPSPSNRPVTAEVIERLLAGTNRSHTLSRLRSAVRRCMLVAGVPIAVFFAILGSGVYGPNDATAWWFTQSLFALRQNTGIDLFPIVWLTKAQRYGPAELAVDAARSNNIPMLSWLFDERKVPVHTLSDRMLYPLCGAILEGADDAALYLIERGKEGLAEVRCERTSPLVLAAEHRRLRVIPPLLDAVGLTLGDARADSQRSALEVSLLSGDESLQKLLNCSTLTTHATRALKVTLVLAAITNQDPDAVAALLECPQYQSDFEHPFDQSVERALLVETQDGPEAASILKILHERGLIPPARGLDRDAVVSLVSNGKIELARALVSLGIVDSTFRGLDGRPLSWHAQRCTVNRAEMIELFSGSNSDARELTPAADNGPGSKG